MKTKQEKSLEEKVQSVLRTMDNLAKKTPKKVGGCDIEVHYHITPVAAYATIICPQTEFVAFIDSMTDV